MAVTGYGQVEFNGLLMPSTVYEIQELTGLADYPEVRVSDAFLLSRHGQYAGTDLLAGRTITLTVAIHASTVSAFATAVAAFRTAFTPGGTSTPAAPGFYPGDMPLLFRLPGIAANGNANLFCRPRRLSLVVDPLWNNGFLATAVVELFANDPVIYAVTQQTASFALNAGSAACVNGGNWPSLYSIMLSSMTGPVLLATVQNNHTSVLRHLTFQNTYNTGDTLYIFPDQRRVIYDASPVGAPFVDHYSKLSSDSRWFQLLPGSNTIAASRSAGTATVTVTWYDTWI